MEITGFFATLAGLPQLAVIPIVIVILALIVRQPLKKAIEGGIKVGMGGLGMLAISYFAIKFFGPAAQGAAETIGGPMSRMTLVDVGWTNALMVLANPMIWVNILVFVAINVGLIWIRVTKTLYVDFPCMWRGVWTGMIVWATTDSFWWGTLAMQIFLISDVLFADWNTKRLRDYHGFAPMASFPNSQNAAIIAAPLAWVLAHIPGLKSWNIKLDWTRKNLSFFAQPLVLGMITGTVLGLLAGFNILNAMLVGVVAAAMFHVWPMALGVMFEGWSVFNEGMRNILVKWMEGKREVYLAVDTSVLLGHPTVGVSTTLMYPIAFLLAVFVPGVGLFPVISVQIIQWWMAHITGWTRGNIIHNLIICSVVVVLYGWAATAMAEPYTFWANHYGIIPADMAGVQVTNWDGGGDLRIFLLYKLFGLLQ
jgi:PTS system galactitol-specific IIC component